VNHARDFIDKLASGNIPAWLLVGAGILAILIALKVGKGLAKFALVLIVIAAMAGAGYWYLHRH
jgi:hypothetical protein